MKPKSTTVKTLAALLAVALGAALPAQASTFTIGGSGNNFTISRTGDTSAAETVHYRTVPLSAFPGQHYTEKGGTLVFAPGQTGTNITVSAASMPNDAYRFQTGTSRSYRFEILDEGGFLVTNATRSVTSGTSVPSSGAFNVKDVTIQSAEYTADDRGYAENGYKSVASSNYFNNAASREYYSLIGAQLRMTLSMQAKENDDAYEYLQLLFGNTSSCDNRSGASNGDPGTPNLSSYMAGFEMDTGSKDDTYRTYTFPVTNVANNAGATNPWGYSSDGKYPLSKQKFNTSTSSRATDGRIVVPLNFSSIVLRLNASGSSGSDEWAAKNVKAHIQAVDTTQPTLYGGNINAISVSPGPHCKGNEFYISIPFNEIVSSAGSKILRTTWGSMDYHSGDGSNVITFKGTVNAAANTTLAITNCPCTFKDLANNYFQGSPTKTFSGTTVSASYDYPISYDLDGGTLSANSPTSYTYDAAVLLVQPTRTGYAFAGWTGSNGSTKQKSVTINSGSHGPRSYVAHWTPITYTITYDFAGGALPEGSGNPATYAVTNAAYTLVNPVRTGYAFAGWTGTDLDGPTNEVTVATGSTGDRSYVATWTANTYSVRFNDNDGSPEPRYQEFSYDVPQSLDPAIARTGYDFAGWCTNEDVTVIFANCAVVSNLTAEADGVVDLYAQWVGHSYSIRFDGNAADAVGNTDEMGMTYDVPDNLTTNGFTRTGYDFAGWSTNANGAVVYADGASISNLTAVNYGSVMLYAQWTAHSYTVHFDANGGEGSMPDQSFTYDTPQALSSNAFTRTGYAFIGWSVAGTTYPDGATVLNLTNAQDAVVSLVAKWGIPVPYIDADGNERICADYTVLTSAAGDVVYGAGGATAWYVVTNAVTISGRLRFCDDTAHLILCDGATLAVTNAYYAIEACNLAIYGQADSTGAVVGNGIHGIFCGGSVTINGGTVTAAADDDSGCGIWASSLTINGGTVTAEGVNRGVYAGFVMINGGTVTAEGNRYGILAQNDITLGWTNPTDSIYANSYYSDSGTISVNGRQLLTDGTTIYQGAVDCAVLAGKTLRPYLVPYIDANGDGQVCTNYTVITNSATDVTYDDGWESWYVVTTNVTISGCLAFSDAHLILCDGATLTVTNGTPNGVAIYAGELTVYGQTNGTGAIVANGSGYGVRGQFVTINGGSVTATGISYDGIYANVSVAINGGTVTATGIDGVGICTRNGNVTINGGNINADGNHYGIDSLDGKISLGWTNHTDSIYASYYHANSGVIVNGALTDGDNTYSGQVAPELINGKTLRPPMPAISYLDADGVERQRYLYTVLTNATGDVEYGTVNAENWYVVTNAVTVRGKLTFADNSTHLILCDGAILAVTNGNGTAIEVPCNLVLYGQAGGTGAFVATGSEDGISVASVTINGGSVTANGDTFGIHGGITVTINGGNVTATGGEYGIYAYGTITLGGSGPSDSITASSYYSEDGTITVKAGQMFTDGTAIYEGAVDPAAIAGKTLMPCLSPWKLLQKRLDAGGMVKLAIDVTATNDDATLTVTNAVTLDLNGHVIDADYRFRAIQVLEGGDLVLTNSVEGAGAIVNGQDMRYGGGVYVENGAFTMSGGSICSNIAQQGCGVYVDGRRGSFTMTGGEISGNRPPISSSTMVSGYNGGGVYMKGGMFEMSGGSIADNNVGFNGGGVYMQGGTFTMSGGSVTNNYAPQNGGGVYMDGGTFTISSGEITGNIARYSGGGVFMYNTGSGDGTFTMSGGEISGNVAYANGVDNPRGGGGVFVSGGYEGFVMTGGTIISNSVQSSSSAYGGGVCVYGSATNTISGGMISGNFVTTTASENVWTFGGGVFVDKSTFAMTGGEISGNWSSKSGGGVCVRGDERHLFMMSGGAISGNAAYCIGMNGLGGGGVFVNSGVFEMSGGEISGNTAVGGGGVYVNNNSTFAMTNSVISGNEASKGGGVYMNSGHLYVSGVSSVSGNTNSVGAANNVYLPSGKKIGVGDLSAGASIGVTTQTEPTLANPVAFASGSAADGAHFFSDDPSFAVCVENNSLCLRAITPWERLQKRLDAGGMVKLASDVTATNDDATLMVANAVTLDLNGHVIDADGWFRVIEVLEGGNLTLTNSVEGAGAVIGGCDVYYGGGVYVNEGGAFTMAGGTIFANSANRGGGVYVDGGTIEISGGEISGNTAYGNGGGVYVTGSAFTISGGKISGNVVGPSSGTIGGGGVYVYSSSNSDRSTFTMTGGEISGNVVYASGSTDVYGGGGVYVNENGTFAMSGGLIISNSVQSSGRAYGGGVCLKNIIGTGTMTGGTISGNFVDTTGDGNNIYAAGGGMFVNKCAFTMSGGEISGNWSSKNGGGVAVGGIGYAFVMTGGEISGNTAKCLGWYNCYGGGGVYVNNSATFAMTNSVVSGNVASKGGGVYVNVGTLRVSGSSVVSGNTNSVGQSRNVCLASSRTITVDGLAAGASIGVQTATEPTLGNSVKFATGALAGEEEYFFSDIYGYDVRLNGSDLLLAQLMAFPTYLEGADNSVRSNYVSWAARNGEDSNSEHEDAFLLNVAPAATPVGLRIDGIDVVDGGATVRVAATAGGDAVDMSQVNGVISLAAGDELGSLALTAVPSENVTYENGEATIFVPASDGTFIRARVGVATPGRP